MTGKQGDVFADTSYWIALVVKQDQYHQRAQEWSLLIAGRIITTIAVLLETANSLARPAWRAHVVSLINHLLQCQEVHVVPQTPQLWQRGWDLFCARTDKSWSLTDCISFVVMQDEGLMDALSADDHFKQAGFRPLLLSAP